MFTNQLGYQGEGKFKVEMDGGIGMSILDKVEATLQPDHKLSLQVQPGGFAMLIRQGNPVSLGKVQPFDVLLLFAVSGKRLPIKKHRLHSLFLALEEGNYLTSIEQFIVQEVHGKGIAMAVAIIGKGQLDMLPYSTAIASESEWPMMDILANGKPLSYHQPLLIEVSPTEDSWHEFAFGGEIGPQPIRWIVKGPLMVELVDRYCPGDRFALIMDDRWMSDPTSYTEISDRCDPRAMHSRGTFRVENGYHRLQLVVVETPFGGGRGAIRFSPV